MVSQFLVVIGVSLVVLSVSVRAKEQWEGKIEHVVVLMMENRAFDHLLGNLALEEGSEVDGCVPGKDGCSNPENPEDASSAAHSVTWDAVYQQTDPCHTIDCTTQQIYGVANEQNEVPPAPHDQPTMQGFLSSYDDPTGGNGVEIMNQFSEQAVPVLTTLSKEYALFDGWFASVPGPTMPNRAYVTSGTSDGMALNNKTTLIHGFKQKTMQRQLLDMGLDYRVYYDDSPSILCFKDIRYARPFHRIHQMHSFYKDAASGDLPEFTWLEPSYFDMEHHPATDQHPAHDVSAGEGLIKKVYEAMRASPLWEKSALIITYDEHGGFFDHAAPPSKQVPNPDGKQGIEVPFGFDRLGVRIPTVVVSPWVPKGEVIHARPDGEGQFEHTSIISTVVHKLFQPRAPFPRPLYLTKRDAWAATFETIFSEEAARTDCPETLPDIPSHRELYPDTLPKLDGQQPVSDLQTELIAVCAGIKGQHDIDLVAVGQTWTEEMGGTYCRDAVAGFLDKARLLEEGPVS